MTALVYLHIFGHLEYLVLPSFGTTAVKVAWVTGVSAAVESLPLKDWDNLTVGIATLFFAHRTFA